MESVFGEKYSHIFVYICTQLLQLYINVKFINDFSTRNFVVAVAQHPGPRSSGSSDIKFCNQIILEEMFTIARCRGRDSL